MALIPYRCITPNSMGVVRSWGVRGLSHVSVFRRHANSRMRRLTCSDLIRQPARAGSKTELSPSSVKTALLHCLKSQIKEPKLCLPDIPTQYIIPIPGFPVFSMSFLRGDPEHLTLGPSVSADGKPHKQGEIMVFVSIFRPRGAWGVLYSQVNQMSNFGRGFRILYF